MYDTDFHNQSVRVITGNIENPLEYYGVLVSEDEETITLQNVTLRGMTVAAQNKMFGTGITNIFENAPLAKINKSKIISCNN